MFLNFSARFRDISGKLPLMTYFFEWPIYRRPFIFGILYNEILRIFLVGIYPDSFGAVR